MLKTQLASEGPLLSLPCLSFFICEMGVTFYYGWEGYFPVWASHDPCLVNQNTAKSGYVWAGPMRAFEDFAHCCQGRESSSHRGCYQPRICQTF